MFISKNPTHFNFRFTGMMVNGKLQHLSNANGISNMFNFGDDTRYFDKNVARNNRSNYNTVYTLVDQTKIAIQVRLEDRKYVMDVNVIVKNGTNDIKECLYKMAVLMFEDWVYNGALSIRFANTFAWQAGVAPLRRFQRTGTTFEHCTILK